MPINALIARGGIPLDLTDTMARGRALQQRDRSLEQDQQVIDFRQQQAQNALAQQEDDDAEWDEALAARDWTRMAAIDPQAARVLWDMEQAQKPAKAPGPITMQRMPDGTTFYVQDGKRIDSRMPPAPQQYAPAGYREVTIVENGKPMTYMVNERNPKDRVLVGEAQAKGASGSGVTIGPNGELIVDPKASEGERVSAGYLGRMREASTGLSDPSLADYVPDVSAFMAFASLLDDETGVIGGTMANWALNDIDRQYLGNALDFILAKMRKESGATIKGGEFRKEYINYFPMPDDSPKVREDKARKRQTAMRQLEISAGRAEPAASKPTEPKANIPPPAALKKLQEGKVTTFANGQQWTLRNGQAIQVQ